MYDTGGANGKPNNYDIRIQKNKQTNSFKMQYLPEWT